MSQGNVRLGKSDLVTPGGKVTLTEDVKYERFPKEYVPSSDRCRDLVIDGSIASQGR
jgi:hypothetical protein